MFFTSEGYVEPNGNGGFNYVYQYKDLLGNVRLIYADSDGNGSIDASTEIISEKNYYPFGLQYKGYNSNVLANTNSITETFKFNNKELKESLGLNLYECGSRMLDSAIRRFASINLYCKALINEANIPVYFKKKDIRNTILGAFCF